MKNSRLSNLGYGGIPSGQYVDKHQRPIRHNHSPLPKKKKKKTKDKNNSHIQPLSLIVLGGEVISSAVLGIEVARTGYDSEDQEQLDAGHARVQCVFDLLLWFYWFFFSGLFWMMERYAETDQQTLFLFP